MDRGRWSDRFCGLLPWQRPVLLLASPQNTPAELDRRHVWGQPATMDHRHWSGRYHAPQARSGLHPRTGAATGDRVTWDERMEKGLEEHEITQWLEEKGQRSKPVTMRA